MKVFDDINLTWKGKEYKIPANSVMGAIHRIEEHVTLADLVDQGRSGSMKMGKVASAYATVLRYAGVKVTDEEVYADLFTNTNSHSTMIIAVRGLMSMMVPPKAAEGKESGKAQGNRRQRRAAIASSRKRTRRLDRGESSPPNSGE